VDFAHSAKVDELSERLRAFVDERVGPVEPVYREQMGDDLSAQPEVMEELKAEARRRGLWNLFLPDDRYGAGLSNLEYAPLAEITGWSPLAPEAINCSAPDTGNMEILAEFGSAEQQERWLQPLLDGEIRSCFAMTEPEVASSDATNIRAEIVADGDDYVINGRKWWTSGMGWSRCRFAIVMGRTAAAGGAAPLYRQQSMVIVPLDTPGVRIVRDLSVFGYHHARGGHAEAIYDNVRVPRSNLLGEEGGGFSIAQARLGPGRIHHCMRAIGAAERALDLMCTRVQNRMAWGRPLAEQGVIQEWIADARIEIEQARLLVLKTAWLMDTAGNKGARIEISAIKVAIPNMALRVIDHAIQAHGGGGVAEDYPLAAMWADLRTLRLADGPDEVHRMSVARRELRRHENGADA
jgi:acyl-CoA dehydrogenase